MSESTPSSSPQRVRARWRIAVVVVFAVLATVIGFVVVIVLAYRASYGAPEVSGTNRAIEALPCVTWAEGDASAGGIDSGGPTVAYDVGLRPTCTARDVERVYSEVTRRVATGELTDLAFYVSASRDPNFDGFTVVGVSELRVNLRQIAMSPAQFRQTTADWMTVRTHVDSHAQLAASVNDPNMTRNPVDETVDESFTAVTTEAKIATLPSKLSASLRSAGWEITVALDGRASTVENDSRPGRVTIEFDDGFPSQTEINLGIAAYSAWPGKTDAGVSVYVDDTTASAGSGDPGGIYVHVNNVTSNMAQPDGIPSPPSTTPAWSEITAQLDELDAAGVPFRFGIDLESDSFDDPSSWRSGESVDWYSVPSINTAFCYLPDAQKDSIDHDAIETDLYEYWLSPTRPKPSNSVAAKSCPHGLTAIPAVDGFRD